MIILLPPLAIEEQQQQQQQQFDAEPQVLALERDCRSQESVPNRTILDSTKQRKRANEFSFAATKKEDEKEETIIFFFSSSFFIVESSSFCFFLAELLLLLHVLCVQLISFLARGRRRRGRVVV